MILIIIGLICGLIASILGAGSSMLVVPLLEYVYPSLVGESLTVQTITSAALVLTLFSTGAATVRHHFAKRIPYKKK
ncbi:hypothetical protein [Geomicrobium sp. JCM 19055]|uniref:hypothetical protein n=1 Tax=Geomicrobium sp. JCM 19055 TaxID=1460649 RepID=UPI0005A9106C|nr:hypothetical protein [Geomicrobium sp. JCM 19055]